MGNQGMICGSSVTLPVDEDSTRPVPKPTAREQYTNVPQKAFEKMRDILTKSISALYEGPIGYRQSQIYNKDKQIQKFILGKWNEKLGQLDTGDARKTFFKDCLAKQSDKRIAEWRDSIVTRYFEIHERIMIEGELDFPTDLEFSKISEGTYEPTLDSFAEAKEVERGHAMMHKAGWRLNSLLPRDSNAAKLEFEFRQLLNKISEEGSPTNSVEESWEPPQEPPTRKDADVCSRRLYDGCTDRTALFPVVVFGIIGVGYLLCKCLRKRERESVTELEAICVVK